MNKVVKTALVSFGINIASLLIVFIPGAVMLLILGIIGQVVFGIIYCTKPESRQLGQGMLLGIGAFLIIGFSVCSILLMNTNFH